MVLSQYKDTSMDLSLLCDAARRLYSRNLLAAGDGNLSVRLPDNSFAISPSGVCKAMLQPTDFARVALDGSVLEGSPSSEYKMHLVIFQACAEARVVLHAHPPTAIAWTLARPHWTELPCEAMPEVILGAGRIPILPYARPGSEELAEDLRAAAPHHRLLLLARHGAVAWGESVEEALGGLERVEHVSQILKSAFEMGGWTDLPGDEIAALKDMRERMGPRLR